MCLCQYVLIGNCGMRRVTAKILPRLLSVTIKIAISANSVLSLKSWKRSKLQLFLHWWWNMSRSVWPRNRITLKGDKFDSSKKVLLECRKKTTSFLKLFSLISKAWSIMSFSLKTVNFPCCKDVFSRLWENDPNISKILFSHHNNAPSPTALLIWKYLATFPVLTPLPYSPD